MSDQLQSETALVLFSGGQDSATCLAWALARFARVEMLGFDYGQRHAIELECRERLLEGIKSLRADWAAKLGESHTLKIPTLAEISDTALTRDVAIAIGADGLPNTFVPGRNLVFLTFAAALAYRRGISHIIGGMCETDYSGYPDCRDETIRALDRPDCDLRFCRPGTNRSESQSSDDSRRAPTTDRALKGRKRGIARARSPLPGKRRTART